MFNYVHCLLVLQYFILITVVVTQNNTNVEMRTTTNNCTSKCKGTDCHSNCTGTMSSASAIGFNATAITIGELSTVECYGPFCKAACDGIMNVCMAKCLGRTCEALCRSASCLTFSLGTISTSSCLGHRCFANLQETVDPILISTLNLLNKMGLTDIVSPFRFSVLTYGTLIISAKEQVAKPSATQNVVEPTVRAPPVSLYAMDDFVPLVGPNTKANNDTFEE